MPNSPKICRPPSELRRLSPHARLPSRFIQRSLLYNELMTQSEPRQTGRVYQSAWIISSGAELILGQSIDTNSAWIAAQLAAIGIRAARHLTVDDDLADLRDALTQAAKSTDLVIITGGLGPTADDLTRYALAEAAGCSLTLDQASLDQIRAFFERRGRPFPEKNQVQAMIPACGCAIENTCGTAPGIHVVVEGTPCYAMPGVPFEMKAMFSRDVLPRLINPSHQCVWHCRRLNCFGAGESDIGDRIRDLMAGDRNPRIGTTAELGVIGIRINARADSGAAADSLLDHAEIEIRRRLGILIYGRDHETLPEITGKLLRQRGETLATAESCTGGLISELITSVPGSSEYFTGGAVTYSNNMKQRILDVPGEMLRLHGAVSEPVARAMAAGARARFETTYALAVTGIAGPSGSTSDKPVGLVYIALAHPNGIDAHEYRFGEDSPRDVIRSRAALSALNLLRLRLVRHSDCAVGGDRLDG